jgi:hypothetical protein
MYTFSNEVKVTVRSGETGDVKFEWNGENAICDDTLCTEEQIFITPFASSGNSGGPPWCFLLPDDPVGLTNWVGFTFDRTNPYAPYCTTLNNALNPSAQAQWQGRQYHTGPSNPVTGQHTLGFTWNNLPTDFQLKAIGLTGWQYSNISTINSGANGSAYGVPGANSPAALASQLVPQTLVVLPTSILVHGIYPSGTPDVLTVAYSLSIVGTS